MPEALLADSPRRWFQFRAIQTDDLNIRLLRRSGSLTRKLATSKFPNWALCPCHIRSLAMGKFNQGGNKHHETKTNSYHHSGSSIRVPMDWGVRSAGIELGFYRSDHDF
jgi:hypothetical protein